MSTDVLRVDPEVSSSSFGLILVLDIKIIDHRLLLNHLRPGASTDGLAAVLLDMRDGRRGPRKGLPLNQGCQGGVRTGGLPLLGGDDHVALGLAVVAHALHGVDLGQLVDDLAVFPVHRWETVAPLRLLSLISELDEILDLLFDLGDKFQVFSGVVFEAVAVHRRGAGVEGVGRQIDLQCLRQTPVPLQGRAFLITFQPGLLQLLLGEERADVHRLPELHVGQFTGHGDGRVPLI